MNWLKYPENYPPDPPCGTCASEEVWVYTDYEYAARFGIGYYDYESGGWITQGCQGNVTHFAIMEPPKGV